MSISSSVFADDFTTTTESHISSIDGGLIVTTSMVFYRDGQRVFDLTIHHTEISKEYIEHLMAYGVAENATA